MPKVMRWARTARLVPLPVKRVLKLAAAPIDTAWRLRWSREHPAAHPVPPLALRSRVGTGASIDYYLRSGAEVAESITTQAAGAGTPLEAARHVLDLGCGSGRVIRHLVERHSHIAFSGCDVDVEAIEWASANLPGPRFAANSFEPPLPYEDQAFDLVYSISIFSHLPPPVQRLWLGEVRRILEPGGLAMLTTCGPVMLEQFQRANGASNSADFTRRVMALESIGPSPVFIPYVRARSNRADFPGIAGEYGLTFQTPAHVRREWGSAMDIVDVLEGAINEGQDLTLLRRLGTSDARLSRVS